MGAGKLPVGRATAQPRVNVASVYSPYSSVRVTPHGEDRDPGTHEEETDLGKYGHPEAEELKPLRVRSFSLYLNINFSQPLQPKIFP